MSEIESNHDPDFGRFLSAVTERDIDMLLMEEFHTSADFVSWFSGKIGLDGVLFAGAWRSVSDTDGETDLLIKVLKNGRRIGILIENKVSAPEQDLQAERYHLRGIRSREEGKLDEYVTVMCAPKSYLDSLRTDSVYQHRFAYEDIAQWFSEGSGSRNAWRHHVMREAIEQGRRGYTMVVNATTTEFHSDYWRHLRDRHPRIQMARPDKRGSKSNWIIMKGIDFPKGVQIHHKFDQRVIELGFNGRRIEDILGAKTDWPDDIAIVQKGKTASLSIGAPVIDMKLGVSAQIAEIEGALAIVYRLMPYASLV